MKAWLFLTWGMTLGWAGTADDHSVRRRNPAAATRSGNPALRVVDTTKKFQPISPGVAFDVLSSVSDRAYIKSNAILIPQCVGSCIAWAYIGPNPLASGDEAPARAWGRGPAGGRMKEYFDSIGVTKQRDCKEAVADVAVCTEWAKRETRKLLKKVSENPDLRDWAWEEFKKHWEFEVPAMMADMEKVCPGASVFGPRVNPWPVKDFLYVGR